MSCNPFRRWSRSCPISGRSKPMCRRACKACDSDPAELVRPSAEGRGGRVSKSDSFPFSTSISESFNGRLTFSPLSPPVRGQTGSSKEEDDDAFEHSMDLDVEPGDDAKGIRIFPLEETTESFLSQALSSPLPSQVRRQLRERFGKPNLPKATTPQLDNVMRPLMSSQAKGKRQGAGKDPDVLSRCVRPTSPLYQRGQ